MKRAHPAAVALLFAAALCGGIAHAQTAGNDQALQLKRRIQDEVGLLREESLFDKDARDAQRGELEAFFKRLAGRFRIDGLITTGNGGSGNITGVADCIGVGEGLGVHCILGATWPVVDREVARIGDEESPSEMLKTFNPAVLILGLDPDQTRVKSLLVTADSFSHGWLGRLADNTMRANRVVRCRERDVRCFQRLEITAEPQGEIVSLFLSAPRGIGLTFTMHRDADARARKKQKSLRAR